MTLRQIPYPVRDDNPETPREWLVTNGLGGYASGTVAGGVTRRYHGLLVAALPAPIGRVIFANHIQTLVVLPSGEMVSLEPTFAGQPSRPDMAAAELVEFRLELGLPVWRYESHGVVVEKRLVMPHRQNTTHVTYAVIGMNEEHVRIEIRLFMHIRHYDSAPKTSLPGPYVLTATDGRFEVTAADNLPPVRLLVKGPRSVLTLDATEHTSGYVEELRRGYSHEGTVWTPGYFSFDLRRDASQATLVVSTESWETIAALAPDAALGAEQQRRRQVIARAPHVVRSGLAAELVLAADQFLITPATRAEDAARAQAIGSEPRTVIAGYHWFTDWGRDTMISLDGLTLQTGRVEEAALILQTFASYVKDGLIPNMFPDVESQGLYHTADASLWFFHAVDRYLTVSGDVALRRALLPTLRDVIEHHLRGTRFGIGVDPADGLLRQGAPGYQLTWMDAKVDDWVVTPRRGKAVEINALFYNALRLLEEWVRIEHGDAEAAPLARCAERTFAAFNERFWFDAGSYLFDLIDGEKGNDSACRPNQILAIALRYPVLAPAKWHRVLEVVRDRLLTRYGLRTLSRDHSDYQPRYYGDLRARDAAYHQGTVWPWLIGPFVDAWLRVAPEERATVHRTILAFDAHLNQAGVGTISEIFDAEPPYVPRGCIAQAWSVAEVLRVLAMTAGTGH
jgi:predicted glycogen debranching enzyme